MIQSYAQIKSQANIINVKSDQTAFIQKIYSTSYFIVISIRFPGKTEYLMIGRGSGYEGIWYRDTLVESGLRKRDQFLEYLRKHLSSSTFLEMRMDTDDRIFSIDYQKWGRRNSFFVFYKAHKLYFINYYYDDKSGEMIIFKSWNQTKKISENCEFTEFDEIGRYKQDEMDDKKILDIEKLIKNEKEKAYGSEIEKKKSKFLKRKMKNITADLERINSWEEIQEIIDNEEQIDKLPIEFRIKNLKIKFKEASHFKRRDELYSKIKGLKKGKRILELRLKDTENEIEKSGNTQYENTLTPIKPVWGGMASKKIEMEIISDYKLFSFSDFSLGIGMSASGNDQLRTTWGSKTDYWFHLDDRKSPHIIVKLQRGTIDISVLKIIASAFAKFSDFNLTEFNIVYTQVKNLKGVAGVKGSVTFKKEKRIRINDFKNWNDYITTEPL